MRLVSLAAALLLAAVLGGCGGSSSGSDASSAISAMRSAIVSYNAASPGDVSATASACRAALGKLSDAGYLARASAPAKSRSLAIALQHAYRLASSGFHDCAASSTYDFLRMAQADAEISEANGWLQRARALDR